MDSLTKNAVKEADVVVMDRISFDENILKLCSGLRAKGFDKHADGIERKFLAYKTAANTHLYRAHDEDGEDLINAAHPDGDPNMGDGEHGDVETILSKHKKIVDVIQKEPTGKLGFYVEQCKIALGEDDTAIKKKYDDFIRNFLPDFDRVFMNKDGALLAPKYQQAKLPNGKTVSDYNLDTMRLVLGHSIDPNFWESRGGASKVLGYADWVIKSLYDLIAQIDAAIDNGNEAFDNKQYPDQALAALNPHREEFLTVYTEYGKDAGAAKYHGQFTSVEKLNNTISPLIERLNSLSVRIDRHIIQEPATKDLKGFIAWFTSMKDLASQYSSELRGMSNSAAAYIDEMSKIHRGNQALIDGNKLREFLQKSNAKILSASGVATTPDSSVFLASLNGSYNQILDACKESIRNAKLDDNVKSEIIKHFGA